MRCFSKASQSTLFKKQPRSNFRTPQDNSQALSARQEPITDTQAALATQELKVVSQWPLARKQFNPIASSSNPITLRQPIHKIQLLPISKSSVSNNQSTQHQSSDKLFNTFPSHETDCQQLKRSNMPLLNQYVATELKQPRTLDNLIECVRDNLDHLVHEYTTLLPLRYTPQQIRVHDYALVQLIQHLKHQLELNQVGWPQFMQLLRLSRVPAQSQFRLFLNYDPNVIKIILTNLQVATPDQFCDICWSYAQQANQDQDMRIINAQFFVQLFNRIYELKAEFNM